MRKVECIRTDMKRLCEHLEAGGDGCTFDICGLVKETEEVLNKLAEYEDLEEQGRLIKLPCKVGIVVYRITSYLNGESVITKGKISDYQIDCYCYENQFYFCEDSRRHSIWCDMSEFCKTVFLTRAEAEAKLKELKESDKK